MESYENELEIAHRIALEAAALVRGYHGGQVRVERKEENEPVTEADRLASDLIVRRLREAFPRDAILSEEVPDDGLRRTQERVWMVDPIDGTRDFIRGEDGYAVMIGLCVAGRPRVGVVSQPPTRKTYGAIVGPGMQAWLENGAGERTTLVTSTLSEPVGIRLVASKSHRGPEIDAVRRALGVTDEQNVGGVGLKIGLVAEGTRDLYVYPGGKTKLWDACAPEAIILAAGGRLTDLDGQALVYTGETLFNPRGLVASNGPLHPSVVRILSEAAVYTS